MRKQSTGKRTAEPGPTALDLAARTDLPAPLAGYFAKCEEKLGFVPNVLAAYAFDAVKLQAFIDMADDLMLADSGLSKAEREMIAVAVSAVNHCHYCLTAHGAALRQRTKDHALSETIAQNWRAADLTPKQYAMLEFAVKLTEAPDKMIEADRAALRNVGFSDREIWDIAAVTGFYNMSNRIAAATDMRPNPEYHGLGRENTEAPTSTRTAGRGDRAPAAHRR